MSTRCQLQFIQSTEHETEDSDTQMIRRVAQVYRHSDGYPASVLPSLKRLATLQNVTGIEGDPAYVAANFIFLNKLQGMGRYLNCIGGFGGSLDAEEILAIIGDSDVSRLTGLEQPHFLLGYGVEDPAAGIHGDEEYLYMVKLPSRGSFDKLDQWTVKVSEHNGFPRWDGPTDEAFEQANWQFKGELVEAIEWIGHN